MRLASSEFADDPCSSVKRGTMVRAARALLSAVTRLLILADMADVTRLLSHLKIVSVILFQAARVNACGNNNNNNNNLSQIKAHSSNLNQFFHFPS